MKLAAIDTSTFDRGVFLVNVLGIIYNPKTRKILIGRREKDPLVKELQWSLPGGRLYHNKSIEDSLKLEVLLKTDLSIKIKKLILTRIPKENKQLLLLYFYCETKKTEVKAGEKFVEVKWIFPKEYKKYFRTSVHPEIKRFFSTL